MVQLAANTDGSLDPFAVEDEMYGQSESDDDMMPTPFVYKSRLASATERCHWCKQHNTEPELSLVAQDKTTRSFCSEGCQDNFKDDVLRSKVSKLRLPSTSRGRSEHRLLQIVHRCANGVRRNTREGAH